jgi:hypothetical protein
MGWQDDPGTRIVWNCCLGYTNLPHPKHRFGFKRCIVNEDGIYVYLFGEEGYGKEVLERKS